MEDIFSFIELELAAYVQGAVCKKRKHNKLFFVYVLKFGKKSDKQPLKLRWKNMQSLNEFVGEIKL